MNYIEAANVIKAGLEDLSIDVIDADQEKALEVAVSACERISKYRKKAKRWKRKALEKHPVGHADLQKDIELAPMREKVLSDSCTCKTCKFDPPEDKWPCKDCDMNVYDRWEQKDVLVSLAWVKHQISRWIGYIDQDMINRIHLSIDAIPPVNMTWVNGISISDNATNGDVIKTLFPNGTIAKFATFMRFIDGAHYFDCSEEWWNAPYKAESED